MAQRMPLNTYIMINTRYNDNDVIRHLCVTLPQMTGYVKKLLRM